MTPTARKALLAFAALGLGASTWSSYVHYSLLTQPGYTSVCDVNSTVSCTQAYLSPYGSFLGVPVALAGVLFFTVVLLIAAIGGRPSSPSRDNAPTYIFLLSTIGLAFVLYLAWASFFQIGAVCLLCVATYVAVIGTFLVSGNSSSFSTKDLPSRAARDLGTLAKSPIALGVLIVFAVGFIAVASSFPKEGQQDDGHGHAAASYPPLTDGQKFELLKWYEVQPVMDVPVDAGGAKIVFVKFNDFQCPACRETFLVYKPLLEKYIAAGQMKYVMKHYPLEPECNGAVPGGTHRAACESAAAYVMAQSTGTADKLEQWLFDNINSLSLQKVKEGAASVAGIQDFDARYAEALKTVRDDAVLGDKLEVNATPTFFLNGRKLPILPPQALELLIEHELKRP